MRSSFTIGRVAGIDINIHITWLFIFALLSWSLATEYFPVTYQFSTGLSWMLGITAAVLLFASVLIHELAHSLMSKRHRMEVESITLFFFGGVASISPEEHGPKEEFQISIIGPITSVVLGAVFFGLFKLNPGAAATAIFDYLWKINFALAAFNMIPGYPLDGGRVFRSILWYYTKDLKKSTRIASLAGQLFGWFMVFSGLISVFTGGSGFWYILLGVFLIFLAKTGYEQVVIKERLSKISTAKLVSKAKLIEPELTLEDFVSYCEENNCSAAIVQSNGKYHSIDLESVARVPRPAWPTAKVSDVMRPVKPFDVKQEAFKSFYQMRKLGLHIVPVTSKGKLLGVINDDDLANRLRVLALREGTD